MPPPPQFDLDDPEVRSKVERGEDLGKAHQEDGLPGALHGSVGLLYAATAFEALQNLGKTLENDGKRWKMAGFRGV